MKTKRIVAAAALGLVAGGWVGGGYADLVRPGDRPTMVEMSPKGEVNGLAAAVARARALRAAGRVPAGRVVQVVVRPGRYVVDQPIVLTSDDSHIEFHGWKSNKAVFDAGVELPPFKVGADGVWETEVEKGFDFDQLWINDRRAQRARTPNAGFLYMQAEDFDDPKRSFYAKPSDIADVAALPADELARVVGAVWQSWDMGYAFAESVDGETGHVTFRTGMSRALFYWDSTCPRYALENYRAALDAPGEWFLDVKRSKLLYIPLPGETPETVKAFAPRAEGIVRIEGGKDIRFSGISFVHTGWKMGAAGAPNAQSAQNVRAAAIYATDADDVHIVNCRVAHTGAHGIWLGRGCQRSEVVKTLIEDLGGGGVYLGDTAWNRSDRERNACALEVRDSIIRHGGRVFNGAIGVWIGHAHDCEVVHNEISDFLYTGVSMGWTWGYAETINRDNRICFNHIHHIGQGRLSDMGGVYTLGDNSGSEVCNNWIHDVSGYAGNGSPAWGLYTDEGSHGIVLANNLVERCRDGAVHQHYGSENTYSNNIFATFDRFGVWRTRNEDHVTFRVNNNVFWWTNPNAGVYTGGPDGAQANLPADGNIYWCAGGAVKSNAFKNVSWETWRAQGGDAHGAIADPLFVDPERGDWTLRAESPALKAGFKPFDWKAAGVLKTDPKWAAKAAEETWDPVVDAPKAEPYRRCRFSFDFEKCSPGVIRDNSGPLSPFSLSLGGKDGALRCVDADARSGSRALKFTDSPDLPSDFQPHMYIRCFADSGRVVLRFAYRGDATSQMQFETRDYGVEGLPYATGHAVYVRGGKVTAGGKTICTLAEGAWADFELNVPVGDCADRSWTCAVTPVGGVRQAVTVAQPSNARFRNLTWIGFITPGKGPASWCLDDFSVAPAP